MHPTLVKSTYARHFIGLEENLPFNASLYSKFKHGSKNVARMFGKDLAEGFLQSEVFQNSLEYIQEMQVVVLSSPYNFIPTATAALKDYFIANFNPVLAEMGIPPVQESKIFRSPQYVEDYSIMSHTERKLAIGAEKFHLDMMFLRGKFLIFMDDVRITGSHEEVMKDMIQRFKLDEIGCKHMFMYYGEAIEGAEPKIEAKINHYDVKHLLDIDDIIKNDTFIFNTRNVKFILNAPADECENFLHYQSRTFRETLFTNAIGNSYHLVPAFERNYKLLKKLIQ